MDASWELKDKLHAVTDEHPESSRIRIHRAISWLARAKIEGDDPDAQFMFLWIAFNAAYAQEFGAEESTRTELNAFFAKLLELDERKRLGNLLFKQFSGPIRILFENKYVFEPFWTALREHDSDDHWKVRLAASGKAATHAVLEGRSDAVLSTIFDRLYVLRNQVVHGGVTWNSRGNRAQVKDGARILMALLPVVIDLMPDHRKADFTENLYPVIAWNPTAFCVQIQSIPM